MSDDLQKTSAYFQAEEEVLSYWQKHYVFEKSNFSDEARPFWNILDGPPFVTGMPHYGHIVGSILKDVFPRYKTMQGYRVRRVWGWDCHGLPAENKVENELKIESKKEIEQKIGVKKFIDHCKIYVKNVSDEWKWYIQHIGRWVDMENSYRTMDRNYMESVMWVFKQMYEKKIIYKGLRVSLFCTRCSTPISNFEVAMDPSENYKEVVEPSNIYKYQLVTDNKTYFLAWSTTPWTKLTTTALAVNPDLIYIELEHKDTKYIFAESALERICSILKIEVKNAIVNWRKTGRKMRGIQYVGHYDFYPSDKGKKLHEIVVDKFVTSDEGTGIVTIAPYGEEDLKVMMRDNIQIVLNIDDEGNLTSINPNGWAGMFYLKANRLINEDLKARDFLFYEDPHHAHTVAFCWRCHERLMYKPQEAWYVDIQSLKPLMKKTNEDVCWYPSHFKYGRFEKSMESAPDWCISRSRYWGSPVPVWECECGGRFVPGSIAELEHVSGEKISDLHKPEIDNITVKCPNCGKKARRVSEVLDSWIEAGSASFAERHFPFGQDEALGDFFPPDFISEYTGQIRAWFYVLHVISAAIYGRPAFKNVLVSGVVLGTDGRKMSKNYKNYPDPRSLIEKFGADALRLYLLGSPITKAEDIRISEADYRDQLRLCIIPLLNIHNFIEMYAKVDLVDLGNVTKLDDNRYKQLCDLDKWLVSRVNVSLEEVTSSLDNYDTVTAVKTIIAFIDDWSRWYLRRSRSRVGRGIADRTCVDFYSVAMYVFEICLKFSAPIIPFHTEHLAQKLGFVESIHLQSWPKVNKKYIDRKIELGMSKIRSLAEAGHKIRKQDNLRVRMPIAYIDITTDIQVDGITSELFGELLNELNTKNLKINGVQIFPIPEVHITPEELAIEGRSRELVRQIQALRRDMALTITDEISIVAPRSEFSILENLRTKLKIKSISEGETISIS
jgi:isoleucyl-tRNA synthetase